MRNMISNPHCNSKSAECGRGIGTSVNGLKKRCRFFLIGLAVSTQRLFLQLQACQGSMEENKIGEDARTCLAVCGLSSCATTIESKSLKSSMFFLNVLTHNVIV